MKDLTKYYIDLKKCTEEQSKHIFSLLPKSPYSSQYEIDEYNFMLYYDDDEWWVNGTKPPVFKTELLYPDFIKLFEGGEGESQTYTKEDIENAYRACENKQTYYLKDTTVILPTTYEGVDG